MSQKKHQLCFAVHKGKRYTSVHLFVKKKMNDKFAKIRELPGASLPGPPAGLCPGPNEGLTAAPRPLRVVCVHFNSSLDTPLIHTQKVVGSGGFFQLKRIVPIILV